MKKQRIILVGLSLLLMLSLVAALGVSAAPKKVELSIACWDIETALANADKDPVYQAISNKLNIAIKPINVNWDDWRSKVAMWGASGQLPDVFVLDGVGTQLINSWEKQGIVKGIAAAKFKKYPNLTKYMDAPDIRALNSGGKYYAIPRKTYQSLDYNALDRVVLYRWDWAQKAGFTKEPDTYPEFAEMLKGIMAKDPDGTKPVGLTAENYINFAGFGWLNGNPLATGDGSGVDNKWIKEDGKWVPALFSKKSLTALKNIRRWYEDGVLDQDIGILKGDQAADKFVAGKAVALVIAGGFTRSFQRVEDLKWSKAYPGKKFTEMVRVLRPLKAADGNRYHPVFKTYWSESYLSGKINNKKLDAILKLYDFLVSPEGKTLLNYGIEGVDYKKEGNKIIRLDPKTVLNDKYKSLIALSSLAQWQDGEAVDDPNNTVIGDPIYKQQAVEFMNFVKTQTKIPPYNARLTYISTPAKDKFIAKDADELLKVLISREAVEKAWQGIVDSYKAKGLDQMIQEVNAAAKKMGIK